MAINNTRSSIVVRTEGSAGDERGLRDITFFAHSHARDLALATVPGTERSS